MTFNAFVRRLGLAATCAAIVLACSDPMADDGFVWANHGRCSPKPVSLSAARRDSIPAYPPGLPLNYDVRFYRAAQHTPGGFAGFYLGDPVNGRQPTVLMFVDTTDVLADLDSLALYYPGSHPSFARDSVQLRVVRWNWVQLYEWYYYVLQVAGLPRLGLTYTDIQEFNNRLEFGAESEAARQMVLQRLYQLDLPCWLAVIRVAGPAVLKDVQLPPAASGVVAP